GGGQRAGPRPCPGPRPGARPCPGPRPRARPCCRREGPRMTDTRITDVRAWEALDSRGRPTVGCAVALASGATGRVVVPSGASTGAYEARELRDGGSRYGGYGTRRAVSNLLTELRPAVLGREATDQA